MVCNSQIDGVRVKCQSKNRMRHNILDLLWHLTLTPTLLVPQKAAI